MKTEAKFRPFRPDDQNRVHNIILEGLGDHFDVIDPSLNPDLNDIESNYLAKGALFLVVEIGNEMVGAGALVLEEEYVGRIVRVSVSKNHRRMGIGRLITEELIQAADKFNYNKIVVETNDDWYPAINLYKQCGFKEFGRFNGEVHMELKI